MELVSIWKKRKKKEEEGLLRWVGVEKDKTTLGKVSKVGGWGEEERLIHL